MAKSDRRPGDDERRRFMRAAGAVAAATALGGVARIAGAEDKIMLPFTNGERELVKYPQKRPLIRLTTRPPQLETPFSVFDEGVITPNDAFFVRYHLSDVPLSIDPESYRIRVHGMVGNELSLSLDDLKHGFQPVEVVAVNQCSGNSRGLFEPRVSGGQLGNGAMGNARWTGVPLRDVLQRANVSAGAVQVSFNGLDKGVSDATPDFVKALDIDHALDGEVMLAYAMNGQDIPMLNGYPVKLIVPGHYGTYWVKHVIDINVLAEPFEGFWMNPAYRIPDNACACVEPGAKPAKTVPIGRFDVRSFITSVADGARVPARREIAVKGIAFDGGFGIREVMLSADGGRTWRETALGEDLGKYSFRQWRAGVTLPPGVHELKVRAVNRIGQSQPMQALWNPAGYMRNVVETVRVRAA